jgi:hypothetical protein
MNAPLDPRQMTAQSMGADLLNALLLEIKLLAKPWPKMSERQQNDLIDRLRKRIKDQVAMAVHILASDARVCIAGDLDQITIKDGVKAVIKMSSAIEQLSDLCAAQGRAVLVVVANPGAHTEGMDDIKGEPDQRAMDLGHEYRQDDGGGMEDGSVIEGELVALPAPVEPYDGDPAADPLYLAAVRLVIEHVNTGPGFIASELRIPDERVERLLQQMEADRIVSAPDAGGGRHLMRNEAAIRKLLGDDEA